MTLFEDVVFKEVMKLVLILERGDEMYTDGRHVNTDRGEPYKQKSVLPTS